jgi:hypothetical protein
MFAIEILWKISHGQRMSMWICEDGAVKMQSVECRMKKRWAESKVQGARSKVISRGVGAAGVVKIGPGTVSCTKVAIIPLISLSNFSENEQGATGILAISSTYSTQKDNCGGFAQGQDQPSSQDLQCELLPGGIQEFSAFFTWITLAKATFFSPSGVAKGKKFVSIL